MKTLVFGSLNIDFTYHVPHFVAGGETLSSDKLGIFAGGKGLNQAAALAKAGAEVFMAGAVGIDGGFLSDMLKEAGVDTRFVAVREDARTGHAIIQKEPGGGNCILLYGGANQTVDEGQIREVLGHFGAGDLLVLQNEISGLPFLIAEGHRRGMTVVLNPSPMDDAILKLPLEKVDCFLLNEVEAGQLLGREVSHRGRETMEALLERFPGARVVLTLGEKGSWYGHGEESFHQPIFPVTAVDTTAAGDTFTGFFLGALQRGRTAREAMALGARASAIAVTRPGACPSIPELSEVENWG